MKCPNCQSELSPGDRFCSNCGHPVTSAPAPDNAQPERVYTSPLVPGEIHCFEGHSEEVIKVAFSPDGRQARSVSRDGVMMFWDLQNRCLVKRLLGPGESISAVAFSRNGNWALTSSSSIYLWDLEAAQKTETQAGNPAIRRLDIRDYSTAAALSPTGRFALLADTQNAIHLWDLTRLKEQYKLEGHTSMVTCLDFSPNGLYCLSGAMEADLSDRAVIQWDFQTGRELRHPERWMMLVPDAAFSADSKRALACTMDGNIYMWEVESGAELHRYEGSGGNVMCIAFAPDDRHFLSGSGTDFYDESSLRTLGVDNTVRLWDVEAQSEIHRFEGHRGNVNCVAFSPDGEYALSGSTDKTLRFWRLLTKNR